MDACSMNENDVIDCEILETPPTNTPTNLGSNNTVQEETIYSQPRAKKSKTLTSEAWNYFDRLPVGEDGKEMCKCKGCNNILSCSSKNGTTHLMRHKERCKKLAKYHDVGGMLLDAEGKLKRRKFDPIVNRELLAEMVISHGAPFNMVEWRVFRKYQKFLNDDCRLITRNTLKADVLKTYEIEKKKLKAQLANISGRVCLTSDCWTACTNHGFISLTAHYVDANWNLNSKILAFAHMKPPHTGHELALKLLEFLNDWGLERKVFSLTLDNASSNGNMQKHLKQHLGLSNSLLLGGEFFHVRCGAHILNLIVQDGLKIAGDALQKIRQSVLYVKASESRTIQFFDCVKKVGGIDTSVGLRPDVATRWNSTYIMLQSAINYRRAFCSLSLCDNTNYKCCPSSDEWRRLEIICEFLMPFYTITNLISGSSYPTSNLFVGEIWKIEKVLILNLASEDLLVQKMAKEMKDKFDKYWSDDNGNMVLAFGAIFDPTKKFNFLSYTYAQSHPNNYEEKLQKVKTNLYRLYDEYVKDGVPSNMSHQQVQSLVGGGKEKVLPPLYVDEDFEKHERKSITIGKSSLDNYLKEERIPPSSGFDILSYWKERSHRCANLARMACDILSIPITTVASESAFSIGSRVLNKYRSSLLDDTVQALLCTRSWLHGFVDYDNEDDDDEREAITLEDVKLSQGG